MSTSIALQDRRGFTELIQFFIVLGIAELIILIFLLQWFILGGVLIGLCVSLLSFFVVVSNPPATNVVAFGKKVAAITSQQQQQQQQRPPILLCLGDSLTHGTLSSNFTTDIPTKYAVATNKKYVPSVLNDVAKFVFGPFGDNDPIWVLNTGQNSLTTHVIEERLQPIFDAMNGVTPDYIFLLIGTNDILARTSSVLCDHIAKGHKMDKSLLTFPFFQTNLRTIIEKIRKIYPVVPIGISTIPPIGETNVNSIYNKAVREANNFMATLVTQEFSSDDNLSILPTYDKLLETIRQGQQQQQQQVKSSSTIAQDDFKIEETSVAVMTGNMLYYCCGGYIPRTSQPISGPSNIVLQNDNIHLNENGRNVITTVIVDWITKNDKKKQ